MKRSFHPDDQGASKLSSEPWLQEQRRGLQNDARILSPTLKHGKILYIKHHKTMQNIHTVQLRPKQSGRTTPCKPPSGTQWHSAPAFHGWRVQSKMVKGMDEWSWDGHEMVTGRVNVCFVHP